VSFDRQQRKKNTLLFMAYTDREKEGKKKKAYSPIEYLEYISRA
jgi:catabolite regulation protein CreA